MSQTAHTPGPWVMEPWVGSLDCAVKTQDGFLVAECDERDGRLIAAAPKLLAALTALLGDFDEHPEDFADDWHAARAAIAEATGK